MTIEPARPEDCEEIVVVWEDSVRATHEFLSEADIQELRPLLRQEYLPAVDLRVCREASGAIVGFLGVADERIEMLFVADRTRGQGIGRRLVEHAINELHARLVDVNEQNPQAVGFYERMGFETFDRSPLDGQGRPFPLLHMRLV